jgi:hypothetical protein
MLLFNTASDWDAFVEAAAKGIDPAVYTTGRYLWSPLLIPVFAYAIVPAGLLVWRLLHVAVAFGMPSWRLRALTLVSWPFWFDVSLGNIMTFVVVAAAWGIRGSTLGGVAFLSLSLLVPRPLMLPIAAWLLWRRPAVRLPFLAIAVVVLLATLISGLGDEWVRSLIGAASQPAAWSSVDEGWRFNVGPSRFIGGWWLLIGAPLAVWLTAKGRPALASVAVAPYLLPYYLLFLVLPLAGHDGSSVTAQ